MSNKRKNQGRKAREPTRINKHSLDPKKVAERPKKLIREGEVWSIGGAEIRGHCGLMLNVTDKKVKVVVTTHGEKTKKRKNIPLRKNWDEEDPQKSYIRDHVLNEKRKYVQRKHPEMCPRDPVDKSIIRHMKNEYKKSKHKKEDKDAEDCRSKTRSFPLSSSTLYAKTSKKSRLFDKKNEN